MSARSQAIGTALIVAAATSIAFAAPWSAFRGNMQRTGYVASTVGTPDSTALWVRSLGAGIVSSPAVAGGVLYVGARDNAVYAIDAGSGKTLWRAATNGWVESSPIIVGDRVIVGSRDGLLYTFDTRSGKVVQTHAAGVQVSSPAMMDNGTIVATTANTAAGTGTLSLYDRTADGAGSAGNALWAIPLGQISYSSPALSGRFAVAGAGNGAWYCVDIEKQKVRWTVQTGGDVNLSTPAIDGGTAYFAPGDGSVYAIDVQTGARRWRFVDLGVGSLPKLPYGARWVDRLSFNKLLMTSPAQRIAIINAMRASGVMVPALFDQNGLAKSRSSLSVSDFFPYGVVRSSSVAVGPDAVYVVDKETGYPYPRFKLKAIDRNTGAQLWRFSEMRECRPSWYCSSPLATANMVFAGWGEGRLYGFDARSGEMRWGVELSGDIISSPALADGILYAATMDGHVYAFRVRETPYALLATRPVLLGSSVGGMRLQFGLNEPGRVKVQVFSLDGRLVHTVVDGELDRGRHTVAVSDPGAINTRHASGSYLIRANIAGGTHMLRMFLIR